MEPIESGTNVDDLVEHICRRMHLSTQVVSTDDEEEDKNGVKTEMMSKMQKIKMKKGPTGDKRDQDGPTGDKRDQEGLRGTKRDQEGTKECKTMEQK